MSSVPVTTSAKTNIPAQIPKILAIQSKQAENFLSTRKYYKFHRKVFRRINWFMRENFSLIVSC